MPRQIAIISDTHALLEPLEAVLKDIKKRGIKEVYSLGDNIGLGPNPEEVVKQITEHNIISIAGNYEEYELLGTDPFEWYMTDEKKRSIKWTSNNLSQRSKKLISLYPHSIILTLGSKKIALCHFANDVRFDNVDNDSWGYYRRIKSGLSGYQQFLHTNSTNQQKEIDEEIERFGLLDSSMKGYLSALKDPLFNGNQVTEFDAIIQGHVHWKLTEKTPFGTIYSIRSLGMAYNNDPINTASYVILTENVDGFTFEEVLVEYDREKMEDSILNSSSPKTDIKKYTNMY